MRKIASIIQLILRPRPSKDGDFLYRLSKTLGFKPGRIELYQMAFRHKSSPEFRANKGLMSNERLEYLGDAILSAVISDHLYQQYPDADEGFLTRTRAKLVSRSELNQLGDALGLMRLLSAELSEGNNRARYITGNALEALVGAVYLDRGYRYTQRWIIHQLFKDLLLPARLDGVVLSYRTQLMEWCQKNRKTMQFIDLVATGPEHRKTFHVELRIDQEIWATSKGHSKKDAKEKASKLAFEERVLKNG